MSHGGLGFKSCYSMNSTFLAKLGWRILKEDRALLVQVLRGKYFNSRSNLDAFIAKSNSSFVWRDIVNSIPLLQKGLYMIVCNGMTTSFWNDTWVGKVPLREFLIKPLPWTCGHAMIFQY